MRFFLSFSSNQREIANRLMKKMYESGHEVQSINLHSLLGENVINLKRLAHATGRFDYVIPILSKDYFANEWFQKELNAFKSYEINVSEEKIILPIIIEECTISDILKDNKMFDFTNYDRFDLSYSKFQKYLLQQKKAFIVMKLNDANLELAYRDGILQALKETKYEKRRIDDYVDGEKISPRILKEIRRSDIVIADLTGERPNCYYEVGYAHALSKKVILSAMEGTDVHFDLRDNNFIFWKSPSDLKDRLITALKSSSNNINVKIEDA